MMTRDYFLTIDLLSETTPGCGKGTAGEVDIEVDHDEDGLPIISGKTLHGLLLNSWLLMAPSYPELAEAGLRVWGMPADHNETAILRVGDASLPADVRSVVHTALQRKVKPLTQQEVLASLTDIRSQTAISRSTGAPAKNTLRSVRVLVRGLRLVAPLHWLSMASADDERCLAMSVLGLRQIGLGRQRGRGYVRVLIEGDAKKTLTLAGLGGEAPAKFPMAHR